MGRYWVWGLLCWLASGHASAVNVFTVNATADPGNGVCDASECTLREAITLANATANVGGPDEIRFNIPGAGPHRIAISSNLPVMSTAMSILGYSQPGAAANTASAGSNAVIRIVIDAAAVSTTTPALAVAAAGSEVSGIAVVNKASGAGIGVSTSASVRGCWLGVEADGTTLAANQFGFRVDNVSGLVTLGGPNPADRNVVAASTTHAVQMAALTQVRIENNLIGLKPDGVTPGAVPSGVFSSAAVANQQLINNTISCTSSAALTSFGTLISGNRFGTTADGSSAPACVTAGFTLGALAATVSNNLMAYTSTRAMNVPTGVTGVVFSANRYIDNATIPIDLLGTSGHTANDAGDSDGGANNQQNYPILTEVQRLDANTASIRGSLNSAANSSFRIEFYAATRLDDGSVSINADFGDAERVGASTVDVSTDASGNANFGPLTVSFSDSGYIAGVAATATRLNAGAPVETSEIGPLRAAYTPGVAEFVVSHTGGAGLGSFKQAFVEADAHPDVGSARDRIRFAIPGNGPHTIGIAGLSLLQSSGRLEIDGSTQTGYVANTASIGTNAQLPIDILGAKLALTGSPDSLIRGLVLRGPSALLSIGPGAVESCFIGVSQDGLSLSTTVGNTAQLNCSGCRVGGSTLAQRNLIGADANLAIIGVHLAASGSVAEGNLIGLRRDGLTRLLAPAAPISSNVSAGIGVGAGAISGVQIRNNTIGGFVEGIRVEASNALIEGNRIGVADDGQTPAPNSGAGINIRLGGSRVLRNWIANNGDDGILVGGPGNTCSLIENTLYANGELGIDLDLTGIFNGDGVSANDPLDPDIGGNNGQNHPILAQLVRSATLVHGNVSLNSLPNTSFRIRYCLVHSADPSGRGECELPVLNVSQLLTTDASGFASAPITNLPYTAGTQVTATAARVVGGLEETSEFAPVSTPRVLTQTEITALTPATVAVGESFQAAVSVTSADPAFNAGGNVQIQMPGAGSCLAALSGGIGSCTLTAQTAGSAAVTASYLGTPNFAESDASSSYTITPAVSSTAILADTPDPSTYGDQITVQLTVSAAVGTPGGSVSVSDGQGGQCLAVLNAGAGTCTLTPAAGGTLLLTANYAGSNDYQPSSDSEPHQVNPVASSLNLVSDTPDPSVYGQAVAVSADLSSSVGVPAGPIVISDGAGASCLISGANGSCNLLPANAGTITLRADFAGTATHLASSASGSHLVERAATVISAGTPFPPAFPTQIPRQFAPLRVPVSLLVQAPGSGAPSGTITVQNTAGIESCAIVLPAGSCDLIPQTAGNLSLTLSYPGDTRFLPALQTLELAVLPDRLYRDGIED